MNDDQYLLANAYFDGELTVEDLRIAEADPDVMSEVDRLRSLRTLLRDSDLPSASVRAAAIAAAMVEFAPAPGVAGTNDVGGPFTSGHITPISRRRPAYSRYLGVAAAVAAVGAVGVVVAGVIGSGSDDESSGPDMAVSTETIAMVEPELTRSASATTLATALEIEAATGQVLAESAPAEGTAADTAEAESSAATTAADDTAAAPVSTEIAAETTLGRIEPIADRDQTITTPGQLAGLGLLLADLRDAGTLGATPESSCLFDDASIEIVDTTQYRFTDVTSTVLVALVAGDIEGHTLAIDPDSCDILVVGP